jgi:hypothetical protein
VQLKNAVEVGFYVYILKTALEKNCHQTMSLVSLHIIIDFGLFFLPLLRVSVQQASDCITS